jgi:hypothetical protein
LGGEGGMWLGLEFWCCGREMKSVLKAYIVVRI